MNFRKISIVAGIIVIIAGFVGMRMIIASKQAPQKKLAINNARMVLAQTVNNQNIHVTVDITGKLMSVQRIEVFSEVSGMLKFASKPFKVGNSFASGETILSIDDAEFKLNLYASKSNFLNGLNLILPDLKLDYPESFETWKQYTAQFEIKKPLEELPNVNSEKLKSFLASKNIFNSYFQIKSQEERLQKYTISAPFNGVIAQASINEGTLVRANQKLGEFINTQAYEIESAIKVNDLDFVAVGDSVKLTSQDIPGIWYGKVSRISKNINASTQTFSVYTQVSSPQLKEGMFLNGQIIGKQLSDVFLIDRRLLINGSNTYAIVDSVLTETPVNIVKYTAQGVLVKGLPNNQLVLKEAVSGAYNGLKVKPVI